MDEDFDLPVDKELPDDSMMDLPDDESPTLDVGEEKEIGKQGLKKKLVKKGDGWETPEVGDEVEGIHVIVELFLRLWKNWIIMSFLERGKNSYLRVFGSQCTTPELFLMAQSSIQAVIAGHRSSSSLVKVDILLPRSVCNTSLMVSLFGFTAE